MFSPMDGSWDAPVCFYYQQGNCRFGDGCHYRHVRAPDVSLDSICWYYQENGWCPHGRSCKFMHNPTLTYHPMPPPIRRSTDQSVCIFFQRGGCKRGNNCSFLHPGASVDLPSYSDASGRASKSENDQRGTTMQGAQQKSRSKESQETSAEFEGLEGEKNTDNFTVNASENKTAAKKTHRRRKPKAKQESHAEEKENTVSKAAEASDANDLSVQETVEKPENEASGEPTKACNLTPEQCLAAQARERKMLKQRISAEKLVIKTNTKGEEYYEFEFSATDPDWRYDFKSVPLRVSFPEDYPKASMKVKCLPSDVLPDSITSSCNKTISKWLEQRMENIGRTSETGDLTFRPFLRWLDRKLEGIFTEGLKEYKRAMVLRASGVSIWTPDKLRRALGQDSDDEETEENQTPPEPESSAAEQSEGRANSDDVAASGSPDHHHHQEQQQQQQTASAAAIDVRPSGVELRLRDLQLGDQTASVTFGRVRLVLQCARCRHPSELALPASQALCLHCERCNNEMLACFRPALLHAFSPIMGYFDGTGCRPVDAAFVEWKFTVTCLGCNLAIDRLNIRPGALEAFKCVGCFKELRFAFNSVHFTRLADNAAIFDSANVQRIVSLKPKKVPKDPAIREGFPLPNEGTCKHYKKSHRWLRFPCCGRAFPCDVCHDAAITDGHEMAFANRMICGFCCKEQAYSAERPCVACHKSMTRTHSSYWEGGKGCRDKNTMSRNDVKKYANTNKTVSKRSQKT